MRLLLAGIPRDPFSEQSFTEKQWFVAAFCFLNYFLQVFISRNYLERQRVFERHSQTFQRLIMTGLLYYLSIYLRVCYFQSVN